MSLNYSKFEYVIACFSLEGEREKVWRETLFLYHDTSTMCKDHLSKCLVILAFPIPLLSFLSLFLVLFLPLLLLTRFHSERERERKSKRERERERKEKERERKRESGNRSEPELFWRIEIQSRQISASLALWSFNSLFFSPFLSLSHCLFL